MKKLKSLRQAFIDSGLNIQPEDLTTLVKTGKIISHYNRPDDRGNQKLKLEYTAELLVMDYSGDIAALAHIVSVWLRENQPGHAEDSVSFELDLLNHETADVLFSIKGLSEVITASETVGGTLIDSCKDPITDAIIRPEGVTKINTP